MFCLGAQAGFIERQQDRSIGIQALDDFSRALVMNFPRLMAKGEEVSAALVTDEKEIAKAAGDEERHAGAYALQQGVRGAGGGETKMQRRKCGAEPGACEEPCSDDGGGFSGSDFHDGSDFLKQVWRGEATKTLGNPKTPEKIQRNLDKAMAKLLKNYPPPPGK